MSFFDDASLVFLPSGGAGKDGKAYSIKPIPEYGTELVTNGDFATDSDWTKGAGWTIANGEATNDGTINAIYQSSSIEAGKKYICKIDITFHSAGVAYWRLGNSSNIGVMSVSGSIEQTLTGSANGTYLGIFTNTAITIDNVSVKEVVVADGDFTFSRGSNLTATRVDSNGLIEKGRENLLYQSNQFDTTWLTASSSVAVGQSGYDGSNDAWLLDIVSGTNSQRIEQSISQSGVQTYSVYVKKGTLNWVRIRVNATITAQSYFDLENGVVGTIQAGLISRSIESVGNGWFRCSIVFNSTSSLVRIYPANDDGSVTQSSGNIYIQDAQLEQGLVATEYIESGASTGKAGILEDSPRFDYSGGASCPSLLLEGSRTNEIGYSEYFEGWTPQGSPTITSNYGTSPEGLENSSRLVFTSASDYVETSVTNTSGVFTIYAKGTGNLILTDSGANASSTTALTSSYQRIELYFSTNTTTLQIKTDSSGLDAEVYAAQFENATSPRSYIPNHSGGSVTRDADVNTLLNQSGVIGQTAGTILFDAYFDEADKVNFSISDSSVSNFISIETTSSNEVTAKVEQGGSTQATITTTTSFFAEGDRLKCAIAYDDRDMAFYINGTQVNTAAPNLIPACDDVRFGNYDGSIKADQRVNRVVLFDTRISNGNLATLTS